MSRIVGKVAYLVITLFVAGIMAEIYLRLFRDVNFRAPPSSSLIDGAQELAHQRSSVPGLAYELAPNLSKKLEGIPIQTNSQGMRDEEPISEKDGKVVRIAVLGDSYTFGLGVLGEETYPSVLEERLYNHFAPKSIRIDVLNFAVIGYATSDEVLVYEHKIPPWDPKLVIIGYCLNDPEIEPIQPLHNFFMETKWWQYSYLMRALALARYNLRKKWYGKGDYIISLHNHPEKWRSVEEGLAKIGRLAKIHKLPTVLVIIPELSSLDKQPYPYLEIHRRVANQAKKNGLMVLDLYPTFAPQRPKDVTISDTDCHPNPLGHRIIAEALEKKILELSNLFNPALI